MTNPGLFSPLQIGNTRLPNRIVMAPMTRLRAEPDGTPTAIMVDYYRQRATAGLIISEGIWPTSDGQSEWRIPGLQTARHRDGWAAVTRGVHEAGGRIFAQLMHGGRKGHRLARYDGSNPAGASAVADPEWVHLPDGGKHPSPVPSVMSIRHIHDIVRTHASAARRAIDAGFDGVELHAANSYLTHQFLAETTNLRTDRYGGDVAGRIRLAVELVEALAEAIGAHRVGIRISPGNPQFGMIEADPASTYRALLRELAPIGLAYLHLTDNDRYGALADLRDRWPAALIANIGENRAPTTRSAAEQVLRIGQADAISFGRGFLRNPDFVDRLKRNLPWNEMNEALLYTPGAEGYSDYPAASAPAAGALTAAHDRGDLTGCPSLPG